MPFRMADDQIESIGSHRGQIALALVDSMPVAEIVWDQFLCYAHPYRIWPRLEKPGNVVMFFSCGTKDAWSFACSQ